MDKITENPTQMSDEELFKTTFRSISGCNVIVEGKFYNTYLDSKGSIEFKEFIPDFKLTKEEFEQLLND